MQVPPFDEVQEFALGFEVVFTTLNKSIDCHTEWLLISPLSCWCEQTTHLSISIPPWLIDTSAYFGHKHNYQVISGFDENE